MNFRSIIHATAIATAILVGNAVGSDDVFKITTVDATQTKMLTTALSSDANYDASESKRVCFTTIDKLKQKPTNSNTATKYKFYVKGCTVDSTKTGTGQCASSTCTTLSPYKVKLVVDTVSGAVKVDNVDRDDGSLDSDDTDLSDSADSDDVPNATATTKPTVGSVANSTSSATATSSSSSTNMNSTSGASTTITSSSITTTSPTAAKNATSAPASAASALRLAATLTAASTMATVVASSL